MKHLLTIPAAMMIAGGIIAQQKFPEITGETVNGDVITLPYDDGKQFTIIGLAYSPKASEMLDDWLEPAYLRFVAQHGLFAGEYDADIYFIPVFVGLNKASYEPTLKKFRRSASPEIEQHVLFSKEDMEPIKEQLGLERKEIPYFFVLDRQGRIVHRAEGAFTDEKLEAIEDVLME